MGICLHFLSLLSVFGCFWRRFLGSILGSFLGGLLLFNQTYARADVVPDSLYTSGRAAAMGNAFLPLADDPGSALFYNPANLSRVHRFEMEPLNLSFYSTTNNFSVGSSGFYQVAGLANYAPYLDKSPGTLVGGGAAYMASFGSRYFSFGLLLKSDVAAESNGDGTYTYQSNYQLVPTVGQGFSLWNGLLRLGYSVQWIQQDSGTVTAGAGNLSYYNGLSQGSAISGNVGANLTLPLYFRPSVNLVARNIGGAHYTSYSLLSLAQNANGVPTTIPGTYDLSFSISPILGNGDLMHLVFETRDVTNQSGVDFSGRMAMGMEFNFGGKFFLRGGYRDGGPSGGIGLRKKGAETSIAFYTEEYSILGSAISDSKVLFQYQIRNF